jgi:hypothetical protein
MLASHPGADHVRVARIAEPISDHLASSPASSSHTKSISPLSSISPYLRPPRILHPSFVPSPLPPRPAAPRALFPRVPVDRPSERRIAGRTIKLVPVTLRDIGGSYQSITPVHYRCSPRFFNAYLALPGENCNSLSWPTASERVELLLDGFDSLPSSNPASFFYYYSIRRDIMAFT